MRELGGLSHALLNSNPDAIESPAECQSLQQPNLLREQVKKLFVTTN